MSAAPANEPSSPTGTTNEPEFTIVKNDEGQYSIWPAGKEIPAGWNVAGPGGSRETCLAYIEENWKDIRPLSVQRRLREDTEQA